MTTYRVWARVAGLQLPQHNVKIGDIGLGPGTGLRRVEMHFGNLTVKHPHYSSGSGPSLSLDVQSPCYMWVDVDAATSREAQRRVAVNEMPLLVSTLSLRYPGSGYWAEITGAIDTVNGTRGELIGPVSMLAKFSEHPMTDAEVLAHSKDLATITANPPLSVAAKLLAKGLRLSNYGGHVFERSAALLAYFQVLEALGRAMPRPAHNSAADARIAEALLVLRRQLAVTSKQHRHVEQVRTAAKAFNAAELRSVRDQLDNAAQVLGLSSQWKVRAHRLNDLRNKRLGHPGGEATEAELEPWFPGPGDPSGAFEVAKEMIAAGVRWYQLGDQNPSENPSNRAALS